MNKIILLFIGVFSCFTASFGQASGEKMLLVIDSIPLYNDPEDWNPVTQDDIADITVIRNKDSLKQLGWEQLDGIMYVFTKAYRNRPDSVKKIPSLKQLVLKNGIWYLNNTPFSGKYIDYYNSGHIQNKGTLLNGKLNGKLIIYFKSGTVRSVSDYKEGALHGFMKAYYKNGVLMQKRGFTEGKGNGLWEQYFFNGQKENETKSRKETRYDTIVGYYSTGKMKGIRLIKNGEVVRSKNEDDLNYYTTKFQQSLNTGDLKEANKLFYHIWLLDSTSTDTRFNEGVLLARELRFDEAIAAFDKVLQVEPLTRSALLHRGLARIKKYKLLHTEAFSKSSTELPLTIEDISSIPNNEQEKICADLQQADNIDPSDYYVKKAVPETILNYCSEKTRR